MKISIALASYNGSRFISPQIESFCQQTLLPDELIVYDDCSTDNTLSIVQSFASKAPFEVVAFQNKKNVGLTLNFQKALSRCSGDIIFLSDQDDVWLPQKIEAVVRRLQARPEVQVIVNDMTICDEHLNPSPFTQLGNIVATGGKEEAFFSGCCTAMRKSFLDILFPVPAHIFAHDIWIGHLSLALGVRDLIKEPLQFYRRHGENASNWLLSSPSGVSQLQLAQTSGWQSAKPGWQKRIQRYQYTQRRLSERQNTLKDMGLTARYGESLDYLRQRISNLQFRDELCARSRLTRLPSILELWARGGYSDFAGWKSAVKDSMRP